MFVKPRTGFQKLLDKKPPRITAYGDSKGLMLFKKFICINLNRRQKSLPCEWVFILLSALICGRFLLENNLIGINQT